MSKTWTLAKLLHFAFDATKAHAAFASEEQKTGPDLRRPGSPRNYSLGASMSHSGANQDEQSPILHGHPWLDFGDGVTKLRMDDHVTFGGVAAIGGLVEVRQKRE